MPTPLTHVLDAVENAEELYKTAWEFHSYISREMADEAVRAGELFDREYRGLERFHSDAVAGYRHSQTPEYLAALTALGGIREDLGVLSFKIESFIRLHIRKEDGFRD